MLDLAFGLTNTSRLGCQVRMVLLALQADLHGVCSVCGLTCIVGCAGDRREGARRPGRQIAGGESPLPTRPMSSTGRRLGRVADDRLRVTPSRRPATWQWMATNRSRIRLHDWAQPSKQAVVPLSAGGMMEGDSAVVVVLAEFVLRLPRAQPQDVTTLLRGWLGVK